MAYWPIEAFICKIFSSINYNVSDDFYKVKNE